MVHFNKRILFASFIISSGVLLSFGFAREFYLIEASHDRQRFMSLCEGQVREIENVVKGSLNILDEMGVFFDAQSVVSRSEFHIFAQHFLKDFAYIHALGWAPRVPLEQKAVWEGRAVDEGLGQFRFWEKAADGQQIPVSERAEYNPIYYFESLARDERSAGFDLASTRDGLDALNRTRMGGQKVVVPAIKFMQDKQWRGIAFVLRPVYAERTATGERLHIESFKGELLVALNSSALVQKVLGPVLQQMDVAVWDRTIPSKPLPIYYQGIGGEEWKAIEEHSSRGRSDDIVYQRVMDVADRQWEVVMMPKTRWDLLKYQWPLIIFFGGLVVTCIGYYIFIINKEFEEELKRQKVALDCHAIVSKTDIHGRITYINDKFCELSQYARSELLGQTYERINSGYHTQEFFEDMWSTIRSGKVWTGQVRNRAKDGTFFWVEMTAVPFFDLRGKVKEHIAICTDITRNIENEKKIEAAMQMKSDFISTVSHELRTPLASIKAALDVVLSGTAGAVSEAQNKFLTKAKANIDRLKRLIDDFLDLSKLESGVIELNKAPTDLVSLINGVVEIQKAVAEKKGLDLSAELDGNLPLVVCDADKISEVFINFVNNALKFTDKGKVVVEARLIPEEGYVRCAVKDTGEGMSAEDLPKLFGKFQQLGDPARRKTGGTGLGLAICKEIVTRHGGKIWVESVKGEGSSFIFTLPVQGVS